VSSEGRLRWVARVATFAGGAALFDARVVLELARVVAKRVRDAYGPVSG
jgi:hypothetical protein